MRTIAIIIISLLLCSCASTAPFHTLNAVDAYQTSEFRRHECIEEVVVAGFIGENPSPAKSLLFFGLVSIGYEWIYREYGDQSWWPYFNVLAIGSKAYYVNNNARLLNRGCK